MDFRVAAEPIDDSTHLIVLAGEVDLYTAPQLKEQLLAAIELEPRTVVIDLTDVTFIDSTTLGVLVSGVKRLRPAGGEIWVVCDEPTIRKVFEITLLDRVFPLHATRADALAALEQAA